MGIAVFIFCGWRGVALHLPILLVAVVVLLLLLPGTCRTNAITHLSWTTSKRALKRRRRKREGCSLLAMIYLLCEISQDF